MILDPIFKSRVPTPLRHEVPVTSGALETHRSNHRLPVDDQGFQHPQAHAIVASDMTISIGSRKSGCGDAGERASLVIVGDVTGHSNGSNHLAVCIDDQHASCCWHDTSGGYLAE